MRHICLISFSPLKNDGRVLRQIHYLRARYQLTVIGYGELDAALTESIDYHPINRHVGLLDKILTSILLIIARFIPALYDYRFWRRPHYQQAREIVESRTFDAFYANEWAAVPIAVMGAKRNNAPVVYDAHEYSPLEREDHLGWRFFYGPMITYMLKRYAPHISRSITVCQPIADRYKSEFGLDPILVLNAPHRVEVADHDVDPNRVNLIHHGSAQSDRKIELIIDALAHADSRFYLYLMLVNRQPGYIEFLKNRAAQVAPNRVTFVDPVLPHQIVQTIAQYDFGVPLMYPSNYNLRMALPNKFFEYLNAGLGVLVGQSPAMIDIVKKYHCGVIAPSFDPRDLGATLNALTPDDIRRYRTAARKASETLNADTQIEQIGAIFQSLLPLNEDRS